MNTNTTGAPLNLVLASPRGFCAGVDRAITIVEKALEMYGAPIFVQLKIFHNNHFVPFYTPPTPRTQKGLRMPSLP